MCISASQVHQALLNHKVIQDLALSLIDCMHIESWWEKSEKSSQGSAPTCFYKNNLKLKQDNYPCVECDVFEVFLANTMSCWKDAEICSWYITVRATYAVQCFMHSIWYIHSSFTCIFKSESYLTGKRRENSLSFLYN